MSPDQDVIQDLLLYAKRTFPLQLASRYWGWHWLFERAIVRTMDTITPVFSCVLSRQQQQRTKEIEPYSKIPPQKLCTSLPYAHAIRVCWSCIGSIWKWGSHFPWTFLLTGQWNSRHESSIFDSPHVQTNNCSPSTRTLGSVLIWPPMPYVAILISNSEHIATRNQKMDYIKWDSTVSTAWKILPANRGQTVAHLRPFQKHSKTPTLLQKGRIQILTNIKTLFHLSRFTSHI